MKKKVTIQNSAIMKVDGVYTRKTISSDEFFEEIKEADEIESYIGYEQNINIIQEQTGKEIPLSNDSFYPQDGEEYLAMVLKYRAGKGIKGRNVNPSNFQYVKVKYKKD